MKHINLFDRSREGSLLRNVKGAAFMWQTTVKGGRALGAALARVLHLRDGGLTSRWYSATMQYAKFVVRLQRSGGWVYVVKYLKACSVLTQQASGGQRIDATQALGCAVSRTRGLGIPRVIPAVMRRAISSGDIWTIRIWLSYFGLYRVIEIPGKLKLSSITDATTMNPNFLVGWTKFLKDFVPVLFREIGYNKSATLWEGCRSLYENEGTAFRPGEGLITFTSRLAATWIPSEWEGVHSTLKPKLLALFKSGPNSGGVHSVSWVDGRKAPTRKTRDGKERDLYSYTGTNTSAIFTDAMQFTVRHRELYKYLREWLDIVNDRAITRIIAVAERLETWFHAPVPEGDIPRWKLRFKYPGYGRPKGLGKLGYKIEPAGKIRVFAMVDSLTQCVMKPVHDLLFSILKRIETDGTFNQVKPAERLISLGYRKFWSLDLSSATDRFPLALQQAVMGAIIGPRLAELWARLLTERDYLTPLPPEGVEGPGVDTPLRYGAGQPMGALTSWAAFSLCHHCLVQFAAYKATGILGFFKEYALLGDDIVLANARVALSYQALLLEIGVEYGLAKSLISSTGGFEFAKRTFSKGNDVSAISLKAVGVAKADHTVLESILGRFGNQSSLWVTLTKAAKVLGYGYRSVARLPAVLSKKSRLQGLAILLSRPGSPWGLSVIDWLLQASPGVRKEVPKEVLLAIGERLWDSLKAKTEHALKIHQEGLETVLNPDSTYGGNVDVWFDEGALHEHSWNVYVVVPLIGELKIELRQLREQLNTLERPTLDDLNEIWARIEELRDAISAIPVVPNFFERKTESFGGAKRSMLINIYRSVRAWLEQELARNLSQRCLAIKAMAMGESEGTDLALKNQSQVVLETPEATDDHQDRDPETSTIPMIIVEANPFGGVMKMIQPRILEPVYKITLSTGEEVIFKETDIHLDGIFHREDISYPLGLKAVEQYPEVYQRVEQRLRDEQYEEM